MKLVNIGFGMAALVSSSFVNAIDYIGVCTHFALGRGKIESSMDSMKGMGFNSFRDEIYWDYVEGVKGRYFLPQSAKDYSAKAKDKQLSMLIPLGYGNQFYSKKPNDSSSRNGYLQYAAFVLNMLKGQGNIYQLWNEWDQKTGNTPAGDLKGYLQLIQSSLPALRQVDPSAKLLVGGFSSKVDIGEWLSDVVALNEFKYADGVAFHPYVHYLSGDNSLAEAMYQKVVDTQNKLRAKRNGAYVDMYITELGWPSFGKVTETYSADQLSRSILLLSTLPYVKGVWLYDLQNDGLSVGEPEHNFGLLDFYGKPKAGYFQIKDVVANTLMLNGPKLYTDNNVYIVHGKKKDGTGDLVYFWAKKAVSELSFNVGGDASKIGIKKIGDNISPSALGAGSGKFVVNAISTPKLMEFGRGPVEIRSSSGNLMLRVQ